MFKKRNSSRLLAVAAITACHALFPLIGVIIRRAELNQDEGWYLYGAGLIHDGLKPYIDFATTQGPVMQYVYSLFWFMVEKWGVMGGRILTAVLGVLAIGLAVLVAARVTKPGKRGLAAMMVFCLAGLNVYQLFFFCTVKTYALAAVWIGLSFLLLTLKSRGKHACAFLAGVSMMLAAATRMSAGAMLPAVAICLLLEAKRGAGVRKDLRWLAYGMGAVLCLGAVFGPFLAKAPESVKFAMFEYHAGRATGSAAAGLAYKGGFIARVVRAYYPAILALLGIGAFSLFAGRKEEQGTEIQNEKRFATMILMSVLLVTLLHFAAPFPYDDYQAMVFPLFCAGVVLSGSRFLPEKKQGRLAIVMLLACLLFAGASPVNEKMFIGKRDRIWWPMRTETSLQKLQHAAEVVREHAGGSNELLTQDLYIAVEAGMKVPEGLELGPFSYFPDWSREKAEKRHVVNAQMMAEILASSGANVAAISEYSLAIKAPDITPCENRDELLEIVAQGYEPAERIEGFGQAETELNIFVRRQE
jgi:hypothetical protein